MKDFSWLPPLVTLAAHSGDTIFYTQALYSHFQKDLVNSSIIIFGKPVKVSTKLEADNRHERFWHTITDPHSPQIADIKPTRAERICWIKAILDNWLRPEVLIYQRMKGRDKKLYLFIPEQKYMVVLTEEKKAYYFNTAFHIDYTYKLDEYEREYKKYGPKTKTAP